MKMKSLTNNALLKYFTKKRSWNLKENITETLKVKPQKFFCSLSTMKKEEKKTLIKKQEIRNEIYPKTTHQKKK